jgi:hypothetical protein
MRCGTNAVTGGSVGNRLVFGRFRPSGILGSAALTIFVISMAAACGGTSSDDPTEAVAIVGSESGSDDSGAPLDELEELRAQLHTTDLVIDAPEALPAGVETLEIEVRNLGPNPATATQLRIVGAVELALPAECEAAGEVAVCELGELPARASTTIRVTVGPDARGFVSLEASHDGTDPSPNDARTGVTFGS